MPQGRFKGKDPNVPTDEGLCELAISAAREKWALDGHGLGVRMTRSEGSG